MLRPTHLSILFLALASVTAGAQSPYTSVLSFCPAGVQPDGFLDWSKLPKPAAVPFDQTSSVTATIPVSGVSNLNATVTIQGAPAPGSPLYQAVNSADLFVGVFGGTPVTIKFSRPVQGFSVVFQTFGRSSHGFHMIANDLNGNSTSASIPAPAEVDSEGYQFGADQPSASPLQILSSTVGLVSATFGFDGDPEENYYFHLINFRVQTAATPDLSKQVPLNGLQAWFRSDKTGAIVGYPGIPLSSWPDQSGNGHDATVPSGSMGGGLSLDGPHCAPVVSFNGQEKFNFTLPVDGWTGMTVLMASQAYADGTGSSNAALFWDQNAAWGETFVSPFQTSVWYRFGTGQAGNQPNYSRPVNVGGDFTITATMHNGTEDSLYINGVLAQHSTGKYVPIHGNVMTGAIGSGYHNTFFTGNIGEILVYDRALSDTERELAEQYLRAKFGSQ